MSFQEAPPSYDKAYTKILAAQFNISKTNLILDIGFGDGSLVDSFRKLHYPHTFGIDIQTADLITTAKPFSLAQADWMEELPFKIKSLDVAFLNAAPGYSSDTLLGLYTRISRIMKPGGNFILSITNGDIAIARYKKDGQEKSDKDGEYIELVDIAKRESIRVERTGKLYKISEYEYLEKYRDLDIYPDGRREQQERPKGAYLLTRAGLEEVLNQSSFKIMSTYKISQNPNALFDFGDVIYIHSKKYKFQT